VSENIELVRSIYADWERGDYSRTDWPHPRIEFVIADLPDQGAAKGIAAMADTWGRFLGAWEGHRVEATEFRELDAERVLVVGRFVAQGKSSGLAVEQTRTSGANLFQISDGRVTRLVIYFDRDRALADLGLEE
jgi:ketosteroid isomerase-like protein